MKGEILSMDKRSLNAFRRDDEAWRRKRAELLEVIRKTALEVNAVPTTKEIEAAIKPRTTEIYRYYFGSLSNAKAAVDFDALIDPDKRVYRHIDSDEALLEGIRRLARKLKRDVWIKDIRADQSIPGVQVYQTRFGDCITINRKANIGRVLYDLGVVPNEKGLDADTKVKLQQVVRRSGTTLLEHNFGIHNDLPSLSWYTERGVSITQLNRLIGAKEILKKRYAYKDFIAPNSALRRADIVILVDTIQYMHRRLQTKDIYQLSGLLSTTDLCRLVGGIDALNCLIGADKILYEDPKSQYYHLAVPEDLKESLQNGVRRLGRRLRVKDLRACNGLPCCWYVFDRIAKYNQNATDNVTISMVNAGIFADQILSESITAQKS